MTVLMVGTISIAAESPSFVDNTNNKVTLPAPDYVNGPTGASVTFNDDGSIKSVYAVGEAELVFGDKKDERQAMQKATLRAKANIAKFFNESISTAETMEEMTKSASSAIAKSNSPTETEAIRETISSQSESIKNSAESILKGVISLGSQIDRAGKVVRIAVGTNEKLMKYADTLSAKTKKNQADPENKNGLGSNVTNGSGNAPSGVETRTSGSVRNF